MTAARIRSDDGKGTKIVVIGGTGLIGSKLVEKLRKAGHEPLAASPDTGVDTITGSGLAEALEHARVVVDVANAPAWEDDAVMDFFRTASRNLLDAEAAAAVGHHVALSVVGADRLPGSGYLRAKLAQEEGIVELAGPEQFRLDELARRVVRANDDARPVAADVHARYLGAGLDDESLTPSGDVRIAPTRFEDWLSSSVADEPPRSS